MKVVVGSKNKPKFDATRAAFSKLFPGETIEYESVNAQSGVSDHPTDGLESVTGAKNRAKHAVELQPGADFYIGIEGGLLSIGEDTWEVGWIAIMNDKGECHVAPSTGIEIKGKLLDAVRNGRELSLALEDYFGMKELGKTKGFHGFVTDDHLSRADAYEYAIVSALAPFRHPQYFV